MWLMRAKESNMPAVAAVLVTKSHKNLELGAEQTDIHASVICVNAFFPVAMLML